MALPPENTPMRLILLVLLALLPACGGARMTTQPINVTPEATPDLTTTTLPPPPTSAPEVTSEPRIVRVWWPELLAPTDLPASQTLSEQIAGFEADNPDLSVEVRLKRVGDVGGIMSTLRTAWAVAPGALPDLTLVRRSDLLLAERAGLIRVLDGDTGRLLDSLYPSVGALGQVNDDRYGVPYLLDVEHLAYTPDVNVPAVWSFNDVLASNVPLTFPVGRPGSFNSLFLAQYLQLSSAGGEATPEPDLGMIPIDTEALLRLFSFYEQASAAGLIDPLVLETSTSNDYMAELEAGSIPAAVVSSTQYLILLESETDLAVAPLPTDSGEPITVVDGWIWVIPTPNTDRQQSAVRFLAWMMDAERQSNYARALAMLPSQAAALRLWEAEGEPLTSYADFAELLLANAVLLPSEEEFGAAGRAIQSALAGVLSGQFTAQQAVDEVLSQVGG
jgi:ABC-type glycerol-3-phosphate transport system substrate-binding protein